MIQNTKLTQDETYIVSASEQIHEEYGFDISMALKSILENGEKETDFLVQKVEERGEDFSKAVQLVELVGYDQTITLMENQINLNNILNSMYDGKIFPLQLGEETFILREDVLNSKQFREEYGFIGKIETKGQLIQHKENLEDLVGQLGVFEGIGGTIMEEGAPKGFYFVADGSETKNDIPLTTKDVTYLPLKYLTSLSNQEGDNYLVSDEFIKQNQEESQKVFGKIRDAINEGAEYSAMAFLIDRMGGKLEQDNGYKMISLNHDETMPEDTIEIRYLNGKIISVSNGETPLIQDSLQMERMDPIREAHLLHEGYRMGPRDSNTFRESILK